MVDQMDQIREEQARFGAFMDNTQRRMEDSDYSRHGDWDSGTMKAAAVALYQSDRKTPDSDLMIAMLKNLYSYFGDESDMANGEDDTRRFMDRADEFKFTSGLLDRLNTELTWHNVAQYRARGWHVVELKDGMGFEVEPNEEGYYIFTND